MHDGEGRELREAVDAAAAHRAAVAQGLGPGEDRARERHVEDQRLHVLVQEEPGLGCK